MIIVSKNPVRGRSEMHIPYEEFKEKAFSEEGLDVDDTLMIDINDIEPDVYEAAKDSDEIGFFTLTGACPSWCKSSKVSDWSQYSNTSNPTTSVFEKEKMVKTSQKEDENRVLPPKNGYNDAEKEIANLLVDSTSSSSNQNGAKVVVFGSSKGGTGKTFTAIISTYRYAKTHPHQKIALVDFDIIDGQIGISIHKLKPTLRKYLSEYQKGYRDIRTMREFAVRALDPFPQNVDFYLAPSNNAKIKDDAFWLNVIQNCIENYDVVVFDTGIDYINIKPISYVYKCADKIILVTTTSIKSVNSVTKQIGRLKGEIPSKDEEGRNVFFQEDEIGPHLHIVITQMVPNNQMNKAIYNQLASKANVIATFGVITDSIMRAEFFGEWNVFDKNQGVNKALDDIMS